MSHPASPERLIQFVHPPKLLSRLPGAIEDEALAALYGVGEQRYRSTVRGFGAAADAAARRLAAELGPELEALPFEDGEVIVAAGDSITDDLQSWARILRRALRRPLLETAVSGDTSVHLISRLAEIVEPSPDWLLVLIGSNDARRHGPAAQPLVSDDQTRENLAAVRRYLKARTSARLVWITPPPVIEERIEASSDLADDDVTWRNAEVAAKAEIVRAQPEPVVDLWPAFDDERLPDLFLPDGLHPSLEGQLAIAGAVVRALTRVQPESPGAPRGRSRATGPRPPPCD
jgi:acyl-CoA thioesterase-1